jgi:mannosyltransferase
MRYFVSASVNSLRISEKSQLVWPITLACVAAVVRIPYLSSKSLSLDEGFSVFISRADVTTFTHLVWNGELNMLLYYMVLRLWIHLGTSEFLIRLLSVSAGVATIPVVYFLGLRLFGQKAAITAAVLLLLHPAHVAFSQEARSYTLALLLICLSSLWLLRMLERPSSGNWMGYAIFSAFAVYSHFFAALVLIAQWAALTFAPRPIPWRTLMRAVGLLFALLAPAAIFLLARQRVLASWVPMPRARDFVELLNILALSGWRSLLYVVLWTAAIAWSADKVQGNPPGRRWPQLFTLLWLFVPILLTLAALTIRPVFVPRFLLVCLPAGVLLAGAGFSQLSGSMRWFAVMLLGLTLLYSGSSLRFYFRHSDLKEDWRAATAYVLTQLQSHDGVTLVPTYAQFTFDYYRAANRAARTPIAIGVDWNLQRSLPKRIWFLSSGFLSPQAADNEVKRFQGATKGSYRMTQHREFNGVQVWLFETDSSVVH